MKFTLLASVLAFAFLTGACEKQSYSETRAFTHHGKHAGEGTSGHKTEGAAGAGHTTPAAEKPATH